MPQHSGGADLAGWAGDVRNLVSHLVFHNDGVGHHRVFKKVSGEKDYRRGVGVYAYGGVGVYAWEIIHLLILKKLTASAFMRGKRGVSTDFPTRKACRSARRRS